MKNEVEHWHIWPKYPKDYDLVHVKRDDKGHLVRWHPCSYFSDNECSQDMNHSLQGGWP